MDQPDTLTRARTCLDREQLVESICWSLYTTAAALCRIADHLTGTTNQT